MFLHPADRPGNKPRPTYLHDLRLIPRCRSPSLNRGRRRNVRSVVIFGFKSCRADRPHFLAFLLIHPRHIVADPMNREFRPSVSTPAEERKTTLCLKEVLEILKYCRSRLFFFVIFSFKMHLSARRILQLVCLVSIDIF